MNDKIQGLMNELINGEIQAKDVLDALCGYLEGEIEMFQDDGIYKGEIKNLKETLSFIHKAYSISGDL